MVSGDGWDGKTRTNDFIVVGGLFVFVCWDFDDTDVLFVSDVVESILFKFDSLVFSIISGSNEPIDVTAERGLALRIYSNDKCSNVELDSS